MKPNVRILRSILHTKWLAGLMILALCGFMVDVSIAGAKDDLASLKREFERLKAGHEEMSRKVGDYLAIARNCTFIREIGF